MKFKVGDKYIVDGTSENGNVIKITKFEGCHYFYKKIKGENEIGVPFFGENSGFAKHLIPYIPNSKIVITSDGTKTTARLYEGAHLVARAEAKCSPSDMFDFKVGADLAYKRLIEQIKPVEQPKHEYKVGDYVTVRLDATDYYGVSEENFDKELRGRTLPITRISSNGDIMLNGWWVRLENIEPYTEKPEKEAVKLYCVKENYINGYLTKGKIYESVYEWIRADNGELHCDRTMRNKGYLVPLVKRPAKVGELVLPLYANGAHCPEVNKNEPQKVEEICSLKSIGTTYENVFTHDEYLVLDGYKPEEEKPKYWSGEVICTASRGLPFVTGKKYKIIDGVLTDENGRKYPPVTSISKIYSEADFIEYKGEA